MKRLPLLGLLLALGAAAAPAPAPRLRVLDAESGAAIDPSALAVTATRAGDANRLRLAAAGFRPVDVVVPDAQRGDARVWMEPEAPRAALTPAGLAATREGDGMQVVGFVVDGDTDAAIPGARVSLEGRGASAVADGSGFFRLQVAVDATEGNVESATLHVDAPGHVSHVRAGLELWRRGDWILRVRLARGEGERVEPAPARPAAAEPPPSRDPGYRIPAPAPTRRAASPAGAGTPPPRLPGLVRVQYGGGVDYVPLETYVKRVLPAEWFPSWATLNGGHGADCLRAGAVAVRSYVLGHVDNPSDIAFDICSTTSCQVYDPGAQSSATDDAADATKGVVLVGPDGRVGYHSTEYSAENNALGLACGDGHGGNAGACYDDAVCGGLDQARSGHGRGMCQRGSARWASGYSRVLTNVGSPHAFGPHDWHWILDHYYPALVHVEGSPLVVGDGVAVAVTGSADVASRSCDGGIAGGVQCPQVRRVANGLAGTIVGGPQWVTSDGRGHTWWKVRWADTGTEGWTAENFLQRVASAPPACSFVLATATPFEASAAGGSFGLDLVATGPGCTWTAGSDSAWLSLTTPQGTGSGTVRFEVARNDTGTPRSGVVTVAGIAARVNQAAGCTFSVDAASFDLPASASSATVQVGAGAACAWTASSDAAWARPVVAGGTGPASLRIDVDANPGSAPRTAMVSLGGSGGWSGAVTLRQAAAGVAAFRLATFASNGTVARTPDLAVYAAGTRVDLLATPAAGYVFAGWQGDATGTSNPVSVTMTSDRAVTASFAPVVTPPRPWSLAGIRASGDGWRMTVRGPAGAGFAVEASPDLAAWEACAAGVVPAGGSVEVAAARRRVGGARYYRVHEAPAGELVLQPGPDASKDVWSTSVRSYAPGSAGPGGGLDDATLRVGGEGDEYEAFLEFDLSAMPSSAARAWLELFCFASGANGTTPMTLARIDEPWGWDTRLWWADRPRSTPVDGPELPAPTTGSWYAIDVTALYNAWQSGAAASHGVVLRPVRTDGRFSVFRSGDHPDATTRPRLVVSQDGTPASMVPVPPGTFRMGDTLGDGGPGDNPVRRVTVDGFLMDRTEVTEAQWLEVRGWAEAHGYAFGFQGRPDPTGFPVSGTSWHDAAKWCNARSEMTGRTPAYYLDAAHTEVYRTGEHDLDATWVDWRAGFRLPTEAEWEWAARGGLDGARFPWGNTIAHAQANYFSAPDLPYDVSPTRGFHPASVPGHAHEVPGGSLPANGYGLHEMSGNVWEWCWDWYTPAPNASDLLNPRGPATGTERVFRGGDGSGVPASYARVASRNKVAPSDRGSTYGFRTVLPSP